jgi:hypothetical protein
VVRFRVASGPSEINEARCNTDDDARRAISDGPACIPDSHPRNLPFTPMTCPVGALLYLWRADGEAARARSNAPPGAARV